MLPYFPRGNGPLVSILLPTRSRLQGLLTAVDSLWSLAKNKSNIEFIFKVDDDDKDTINAINKISSLIPNCKKIVSPRGRGYLDLHKWINQMCSIASGDWLFLFNDDARMITQDWDYIIEVLIGRRSWPGINEICLLTLSEENYPYSMGWFLLRRQTYELLGNFSLGPMCDDWLCRVTNCCGCHIRVTEICINHHGLDDTLKKENLKAYNKAFCTIFSFEEMKTRMEAVIRITNKIGWFESRRKWSTFPPNKEGWMLWKETYESCPLDVYFKDTDNILTFEQDGLMNTKRFEDMKGLWTERE